MCLKQFGRHQLNKCLHNKLLHCLKVFTNTSRAEELSVSAVSWQFPSECVCSGALVLSVWLASHKSKCLHMPWRLPTLQPTHLAVDVKKQSWARKMPQIVIPADGPVCKHVCNKETHTPWGYAAQAHVLFDADGLHAELALWLLSMPVWLILSFLFSR